MRGRAGILAALVIASVAALLGLAGLSEVDQDRFEQNVEDEW